MGNDVLYIVMPAYNEEANIEKVVTQWYAIIAKINGQGAAKSKLLIANDGSKDRTYEMMQRLTVGHPDFEPLDKPNSGHGATVLYLYRKAIESCAQESRYWKLQRRKGAYFFI